MALKPVTEFYVPALMKLHPNIPVGIQIEGDLSTLSWPDGEPEGGVASEADIIAKATELRDAFSMSHLRTVRDELLLESDWMASGDRTMTAEQTAYRQALRDLPADFPNAEFHDDGTWQNVTWPTKP